LEDENFGSHVWGKIRTYLWNLMEYPETSVQAQVRPAFFQPEIDPRGELWPLGLTHRGERSAVGASKVN
jgi:hypothetical protein